MNTMKKFLHVVFLTMFLAYGSLLRADDCNPCGAVDACSTNENGKAIEMDFSYTGGGFGNVRGGERRGSTYVGLAELGFTGDLEKLGLWKNGTFFVGGSFSQGRGITRFVGDYQDPASFAYEEPAHLAEYWYMHRFLQDRLSVKVGKVDSGTTFLYHDSHDFFFHSGFSNLDTPHIPTAPETTWGIVSTFELQRGAMLKFGIHDETEDGNYDRPTFRTPCYVLELDKEYTLFGRLPGYAFIGTWYDTAVFDFAGATKRSNRGFGFGIDQMIWRKYANKRSDDPLGVNFFMRFQADMKDRNETHRNLDCGLTYKGFWNSRPDDVVGIGSSMVRFSPGYREEEDLQYGYETAMECFYRMQVTERLMVQPDFQYIWRPGGQHPNATILGLAFHVEF
jgi:porin